MVLILRLICRLFDDHHRRYEPVCHDHALLPTQNELLTVYAGNLCIQRLGKCESYEGTVLRGLCGGIWAQGRRQQLWRVHFQSNMPIESRSRVIQNVVTCLFPTALVVDLTTEVSTPGRHQS